MSQQKTEFINKCCHQNKLLLKNVWIKSWFEFLFLNILLE